MLDSNNIFKGLILHKISFGDVENVIIVDFFFHYFFQVFYLGECDRVTPSIGMEVLEGLPEGFFEFLFGVNSAEVHVIESGRLADCKL